MTCSNNDDRTNTNRTKPTTEVLCNYAQVIPNRGLNVCKQKQSECPFRNTFKWKLLLCSNRHLKVFLNGHLHCFCLHAPKPLFEMTYSWLHRTSVVGLVLFYYHYLNISLLLVGLQITFSDLSYVSGLDILSSYFISFIIWIADIG